MKSVFIGRKRDALFRGTIEYLLSDKELQDLLVRNGQFVAFTYSMSLSHTYRAFLLLHSFGLRQMGSCFVYDQADKTTGVLVYYKGIVMKRSEGKPNVAVVRFPGTKEFTEDMVTTE